MFSAFVFIIKLTFFQFPKGKEYPVKRISDLREENPETCIVVGTLFVHQKLKPSILREISEETQLAPQPVRTNCSDESDVLILEDEVQRIQLLGEMKVEKFVTGIVCAILGRFASFDGKKSIIYNKKNTIYFVSKVQLIYIYLKKYSNFNTFIQMLPKMTFL